MEEKWGKRVKLVMIEVIERLRIIIQKKGHSLEGQFTQLGI
jgi:hypothetical protein